VVVGSPIANRNRSEIEGLIGFFVNTLVLRGDLEGEPGFRGLVRRTREMTLGAYAHQDLPFEKLVEELRPERRLSHTPLFQVMLLFQNVAMGAGPFAGLEVTPLEVNNGTAKFDLSWAVIERPDGLRVGLTYNSDLFPPATARRMRGHFRQLLEAAAAEPDCRLSALPMLTAGERRQLLHDWNDTAADYPRGLCLHQLFEAQAARVPDAVAVTGAGRHLTYRQLNEAANRLAHRLRGLGAGPGRLVAVCLGRSPELLVGLLGVPKSGAAYVPLDPAYPKDRLAYMLEDTKAPLVLTQGALLDRLSADPKRLVNLDELDSHLANFPDAEPERWHTPDALAYVIYPSGSTGKPKGVMNRHRGPVNTIDRVNQTFGVSASDKRLFVTSPSFALRVYGVFGVLGRYTGFDTVVRAMQHLPPDYHPLVFGGVHPRAIRTPQRVDPIEPMPPTTMTRKATINMTSPMPTCTTAISSLNCAARARWARS